MSDEALTDFLHARIDEDEQAGKDPYVWQFSIARWEAECEAKRRIVEIHAEYTWSPHIGDPPKPMGWCRMCAENEEADYEGAPVVDWPCPTVRALAAVYSDHPDFREEWRP